jgi:bacterioferritin-associated ferredoxin
MILCHCQAVSDREIRRIVRAGATIRHDVMRECGAGELCGGCVPLIDKIVAEETAERAEAGIASLVLVPAP